MPAIQVRQRELSATLEQAALEVLRTPQSASDKWARLIPLLRSAQAHPDLYRQLWDDCYRDWDAYADGPAPMCLPEEGDRKGANLAEWMLQRRTASVAEFHQWSVDKRAEFWEQAIERLQIRFHKPPRAILNPNDGPENPHWLPGAELNIAESCFQAAADTPAIVFRGPDQPLQVWSYAQLNHRVQEVAAAIRAAGFQEGDALAVVLPMTAESVALYLGIIWAGCVAVSIADSFAPPEIASRLRIAHAKAVFTYDVQVRAGKTLPLFARVLEATNLPIICLPSSGQQATAADKSSGPAAVPDLRPQDMAWRDFLSAAGPSHTGRGPHHGTPIEPINILFSSGTTGDPKAIPWTQLTPLKCAIDGHCLQDIRPGQRVAWPTNLGWMMGPFLIFAALINRATIALYEDAPLGEDFGKFIEEAEVNMLGVVPTIVKTWRTTGCMEACDWSKIHVFSSTGESSQRDDMFYLSALAGMRPVIEYCGGTEIGGGFISSTVLQPNAPSTFSTPALGIDFLILDELNQLADEGELFLIPPSIGLSQRLLNRDHHQTYYAETPRLATHLLLRRHGDHFRRLPGNYYMAGGRVDDTMNLGGIKISSAELERIMNRVPGVRETAAVAWSQNGGPEELVVVTVLDQPAENPTNAAAHLLKAFNERLKADLNPLFRAREVRLVTALPRTASNKVMRRELRAELGS
ncbi:MAG: AMP-binding protein [Planctomycetota bacterium]